MAGTSLFFIEICRENGKGVVWKETITDLYIQKNINLKGDNMHGKRTKFEYWIPKNW